MTIFFELEECDTSGLEAWTLLLLQTTLLLTSCLAWLYSRGRQPCNTAEVVDLWGFLYIWGATYIIRSWSFLDAFACLSPWPVNSGFWSSQNMSMPWNKDVMKLLRTGPSSLFSKWKGVETECFHFDCTFWGHPTARGRSNMASQDRASRLLLLQCATRGTLCHYAQDSWFPPRALWGSTCPIYKYHSKKDFWHLKLCHRFCRFDDRCTENLL